MAREEVLWIFNILPTSKHLTTWHVLTLCALKLSLSDWEFQPGGRNALKLWDRSMTGVSKGQQRGPCCWRLGNKRGAIVDAFRKSNLESIMCIPIIGGVLLWMTCRILESCKQRNNMTWLLFTRIPAAKVLRINLKWTSTNGRLNIVFKESS